MSTTTLTTAALMVAGAAAVALSVFNGIGMETLFNVDALLIVLGGTTVALFVGFPPERIRNTIREVAGAFREGRDRETAVRDVLEVARLHRRSGIKALEAGMKALGDDFLRLGVSLLINYHRDEEIRRIMEREMAVRVVNYNLSQNVLRTIGRLTPSLGLAGTVISLIKMFRALESLDDMAPLMAVALMSTFYGVVISNLLVTPLAAKLKERTVESEILMNITIEGVVAISRGEHPLKIEERIRGRADGDVEHASRAHSPELVAGLAGEI